MWCSSFFSTIKKDKKSASDNIEGETRYNVKRFQFAKLQKRKFRIFSAFPDTRKKKSYLTKNKLRKIKMLSLVVLRPCLPLACRIFSRNLSKNSYLMRLPLRIIRTRKWLHWQPNLFVEPSSNCFLTKALFHTNSPNATTANDATESPESNKRLSSKRRRIISDSSSSDGENGTRDVNRKSESVLPEQ